MGYTLKKSVVIEGIGIHSGQKVRATFVPSLKGGIQFKVGEVLVALKLKNIKPINLGTNLVDKNIIIKTIEHLMAVLWYLQITDLIIEIVGEEIPIADGSGLQILNALKDAGLKKTPSIAKSLIISKPFFFTYKDTFFFALPAKELQINYTINFPLNPIKGQNFNFAKRQQFVTDILSARTFGNIEDVEKLHSVGKALGATLENALVYNSQEFVNTPRYENEPVRHKILDLLGDLYTSGYFIKGKIYAYKTSHLLNNKIVKKLLKQFAIQ